jgi:transposase
MPFKRTKPELEATTEMLGILQDIKNSRTAPFMRVERARMILEFIDGVSITKIAETLVVPRLKVERCINKALQFGILVALDDLPGRGRPSVITDEAKAWLISLACTKPKELGYSYELWTNRLLAKHVRENCVSAGHSCLSNLARGTVSKILSANSIKPHKIQYYLERKDPQFNTKMAAILCVYREVALILDSSENQGKNKALKVPVIISFDEKPGIQAIKNTAPDLPPVLGAHPCVGRDYEYIRHGTLSLLAGINLCTGIIHGIVEERHRSLEFVKFLQSLDDHYKSNMKIKIILDNHSAHISKETKRHLATVPNRFEFVFTPTHGSWLNIIESFFAKMTKTMLRGIRVGSLEELKERIEKYIEEVNQEPVVFRWTFGLDDMDVQSLKNN